MPRRKPRTGRYRPHRMKAPRVPKRGNEQAIILSGLNALQVLEDHAPKYLKNVLHYGPDTFAAADHAAAIVWYRRKGYQHHQKLTLFGVWVAKQDCDNQIVIGSRILPYKAAVYNAESYNTIIQKSFVPYYGNEFSPPHEKNTLWQTPFDVTKRLALRRELADQLAYWFKNTLFT